MLGFGSLMRSQCFCPRLETFFPACSLSQSFVAMAGASCGSVQRSFHSRKVCTYGALTSTVLLFKHVLIVQTNGFHCDSSMPDCIYFNSIHYPLVFFYPFHLAKFLFYSYFFIFLAKVLFLPRHLFPVEAGSQWHICSLSIQYVPGQGQALKILKV